jgi:hypothetical protein
MLTSGSRDLTSLARRRECGPRQKLIEIIEVDGPVGAKWPRNVWIGDDDLANAPTRWLLPIQTRPEPIGSIERWDSRGFCAAEGMNIVLQGRKFGSTPCG